MYFVQSNRIQYSTGLPYVAGPSGDRDDGGGSRHFMHRNVKFL